MRLLKFIIIFLIIVASIISIISLLAIFIKSIEIIIYPLEKELSINWFYFSLIPLIGLYIGLLRLENINKSRIISEYNEIIRKLLDKIDNIEGEIFNYYELGKYHKVNEKGITYYKEANKAYQNLSMDTNFIKYALIKGGFPEKESFEERKFKLDPESSTSIYTFYNNNILDRFTRNISDELKNHMLQYFLDKYSELNDIKKLIEVTIDNISKERFISKYEKNKLITRIKDNFPQELRNLAEILKFNI